MKSRFMILMCTLFVGLSLASCSSATPPAPEAAPTPAPVAVAPAEPEKKGPSLSTDGGEEQPCWVNGDPGCQDETNEYLYFVGQNAVPEASNARPSRSSFDSARMAATRDYVQFLETKVATKAAEANQAAGDTTEGSSAVATYKTMMKTFAEKTVSGVKQVDSYYVSESTNSSGVHLWTVYVLVRIPTQQVKEKFDTLAKNIEDAAGKGQESAKKVVEGIKAVNDAMKEDDFFKDL